MNRYLQIMWRADLFTFATKIICLMERIYFSASKESKRNQTYLFTTLIWEGRDWERVRGMRKREREDSVKMRSFELTYI